MHADFAAGFAAGWRGTDDRAASGAHFAHGLQRACLEKLLDFFDALDAAEEGGQPVDEAHWADRRSLAEYVGCLAQRGLVAAQGASGVLDELLENACAAAARGPAGRRACDECVELACKLTDAAAEQLGAEGVERARARLRALADGDALSSRVRFLVHGDSNRRHVAPATLAQVRQAAPQDLHDLLRGDTGGGGGGARGTAAQQPAPSFVTKTRTIKRRNADGTVETVVVSVQEEVAPPIAPPPPSRHQGADRRGRGGGGGRGGARGGGRGRGGGGERRSGRGGGGGR